MSPMPIRKYFLIMLAPLLTLTMSGAAVAKQDVTVEIFYSSAWHDVSDRWRVTKGEIVINHGAGNEQSGVVPSDASLVLDNRDGEMNPDNRKSSLFGLIGHNTPIRISVGSDIRFSGQVVSWQPRRAIKGDAWVNVQAQGTIRRLGQGSPPAQSALRRLYDASSPTTFWALSDGQLTSAAAVTSGTGGSFSEIQGTSTLGIGEVAPWVGTGLSLSRGEVTTIVSAPVPANPTTRLVVDTTFSWNALGQSLIILVGSDASGTTTLAHWWTSVFGDGVLTYGNEAASIATSGHDFSGVHHIRLDIVQDGADADLTVYVDGVAQTTYTDTSYTLADYTHLVFKYDDSADPEFDAPIILSSVAVYVDATPPAVADASSAAQGYSGETAGARFSRLCDEEDIAATIVGVEADTQPMGPQHADTLLDLFDEIARTDAGIIHDTRSQLGLTFRTGRSLYNQ